MEQPRLSVAHVSKSFTGRRVLDDVSLEIKAGEIHALLGQNGSGKSTLIKILTGYHSPDSGALALDGQPVALPISAATARKLGIAVVHQELGLADRLTVLENLRVGRYDATFGWRIPWRAERRAVRALLRDFGLTVSGDTPVSRLREVDRAMVAIIRALNDIGSSEGRGVLILDEPTAYLPRDSTDRLFGAVQKVAERGVGVLFVTHRLQEALSVADRISVLRDGRLVGTDTAAHLSEATLVERVLGFAIDRLYPPPHEPEGEIVLAVDRLSGEGVNPVSFQLHKGEIIGMTGLVGMGWDRLPYLLVGADHSASGRLTIKGRLYDLAEHGVRDMLAAGLALLPANRMRDGAVGLATVMENLSLPTLNSYYQRGFLRHRQERMRAHDLLHAFDVRPPDPHRRLATLSGGNQQKVLLAKWFDTNPDVFVMHEPTQGVDVGARQRIFKQIGDAARAGQSFVLASAEYDDLAHLCDRVLVFRDGSVVASVGGEGLTGERLVELSFRDAPAATAADGTAQQRPAARQSTSEGGS